LQVFPHATGLPGITNSSIEINDIIEFTGRQNPLVHSLTDQFTGRTVVCGALDAALALASRPKAELMI
jgi:hypothetical protein